MFYLTSGKICKHAIAARMQHGLAPPTADEDTVPEAISNQSDEEREGEASEDEQEHIPAAC
jgi:hypothetical protein